MSYWSLFIRRRIEPKFFHCFTSHCRLLHVYCCPSSCHFHKRLRHSHRNWRWGILLHRYCLCNGNCNMVWGRCRLYIHCWCCFINHCCLFHYTNSRLRRCLGQIWLNYLFKIITANKPNQFLLDRRWTMRRSKTQIEDWGSKQLFEPVCSLQRILYWNWSCSSSRWVGPM